MTVPLSQTDAEALDRRPTGIRPSTYMVSLFQHYPEHRPDKDSDGATLARKDAVSETYVHLSAEMVERIKSPIENPHGLGYAAYLRTLLRRAALELPRQDVFDAAPTDLRVLPSQKASEQRTLPPKPPTPPPHRPPVLLQGIDTSVFLTGPQPDLRWVEHPAVELDLVTLPEFNPLFVTTAAGFKSPWVAPQGLCLLVVGMDAAHEPKCAERSELDALLGHVMLQIYARARERRHRLMCQWRRVTTTRYGTTWHLAEIEVKRIT